METEYKVVIKGANTKVLITDGIVRVWDEIARYYTTCHSLTPRQIKRIKAMTGYEENNNER
jgi:hypothetical protein